MFILDLSAGLDFIQSPAAIREAFESINSNEHAVMRQRRFKDRWNSWVGDQRSGAAARLSSFRTWSLGMPAAPNRSTKLAGLVSASARILITASSISLAASRQPSRSVPVV